jgi:Fic-DOC domain mobile mystery protein B
MRLKTTHGATPIEDADGLIPPIRNRAELNAREAENILQAMGIHLIRRRNIRKPWLTEKYIRRIHRDMFGKVWKWAGYYRDTSLNIGVPIHQIREEIGKLCEDVAYWDLHQISLSILERAARIHHRLAWIHPFKNGNGRLARFMSDIYLNAHRHPLPNWPDVTGNKEANVRNEYLKALRRADSGDFAPLIDFVSQFIKTPLK